jgi:iron complex outermembrane receptor protein
MLLNGTAVFAATTTTVVDVPAAHGTQRFLHVRPDSPVATIVHLPGGDGTLGIQDDGTMTARAAQCSPVARNRLAFAQRGLAIALVDATSAGHVREYSDVREVVRRVRELDDVPVWIVGGSAATAAVTTLTRELPPALPVGAIFLAPASLPASALAPITRPALVTFHRDDPDHAGDEFFDRLTSAFPKARVVLEGGSNSGCGYHVFNELDTQFVDTTAGFIERHNASLTVVHSQDPGAKLDEILVVAQKRTQSVQDIPIAISAFAAETLAELRILHSDDLARFTPNLTWQADNGAGGSVGLRGVIDTVFTTNQVGSVAIVVDEVGLNSPVVNTFSLYDLERVEVLRGPQVTLYGRSTTGGAINFITRRPRVDDGANGYLQGTYGDYQHVSMEAAGGVPLNDRLAVRAAGFFEQRDGTIDNRTSGSDEMERDRRGARLSLAGELADNLTIFTSINTASNRGDSARFKNVGMLDPLTGGPCRTLRNSDPGNGCVDARGFADSSDFSENYSDLPEPTHDVDAHGGTVNLAWQIDAAELVSITAYHRNEIEHSEDSDGSPLALSEVYISADTEQFSQEIRLASTNGADELAWIGGIYYLNEEQDGLTANMIREPTSTGAPPQFRSQAYDQTNEILSGYAQVDVPFAQRWTLTAGARYSSESKDGVNETLRAPVFIAIPASLPLGTFLDEDFARSIAVTVDAPPPDFKPVAGPFLAPFDKTWNDWGGKLALSFRPSERSLLYGSVSNGFKGGTFNFVAAVRLSSEAQRLNFQQGVDPEELTTYEVGGKFELLERTLRLNLALFHNDYSDQQTLTFKDGGLVLVNAAESSIDGAELELEWLPADGWVVRSALGVLDTVYDDFIDADGSDYSGNDIIQAPDLNWSGVVSRSWDTTWGALSAQASFRYVGDQYFGVDNSPATLVESYATYDAQLSLGFGEAGRYELTAWGHNLGDERFCSSASTVPLGSAQCIANEPRTYGVTLRATLE